MRRVLSADEIDVLTRYVGGESQDDIAAALGRSQPTVSRRIAGMKQRLAESGMTIQLRGPGRPRKGSSAARVMKPESLDRLVTSGRVGSVSIARRYADFDEETN